MTTIKHPELYRGELSCRIGMDVIDGKTKPPKGVSEQEYTQYLILAALEDLFIWLQKDDENGLTRD